MTKTKYEALEDFLKHQNNDAIPIKFEEIERIIGAKLPASAFKHRPWWSNNPSNSVITNAWLNAGFKTEKVDMKAHELVFRRIGGPKSEHGAPEPSSEGHRPKTPLSYALELRHPLWGVLKGTIRVTRGTDLTEPADPEWGRK